MSKLTARFLMFLAFFIGLYAWWIVSWSFYDERAASARTYTPRSCTIFAQDFTQTQKVCCDTYSRAYWEGGSYEQKLLADHEFLTCIDSSGTPISQKSRIWHTLQKFTSTPYIHTPWRWGHGWSFGRGYRD